MNYLHFILFCKHHRVFPPTLALKCSMRGSGAERIIHMALINEGIFKHKMEFWPTYLTCGESNISHITLLSSLYSRIWKYWNFKMLQVHSVSSLGLRSSKFCQLSFMQYMGRCIFSLHIYLVVIVRICIIYLFVIIKSEVWPICRCLQLGHETLVCAVCLLILLWICHMAGLLRGTSVS